MSLLLCISCYGAPWVEAVFPSALHGYREFHSAWGFLYGSSALTKIQKWFYLTEHTLVPGHGKTHKDAASVRATHPIPAACGLYYFEVRIVSKGRDGYMGIGLSAHGVNMNRLPGEWTRTLMAWYTDRCFNFLIVLQCCKVKVWGLWPLRYRIEENLNSLMARHVIYRYSVQRIGSVDAGSDATLSTNCLP